MTVKQRTKSLAKAFDEIDRAKALLAEIEADVESAADGGRVDLADFVSKTITLKESRELILVSVIEGASWGQDVPR